jgi:hypothetical protein
MMKFKNKENQEKYWDLMIKIDSLYARIIRKIYIMIQMANAYRYKETKGKELQLQKKIIGLKAFVTYVLTIRYLMTVFIQVNI